MPTFSRTQYIRKFDGLLISILLICESLQKSYLSEAFLSNGNVLTMGIQTAIILYFCISEIVKGNISPALIFTLFVTYLLIECNIYSNITNQTISYNAIFAYMGLMSFIPFVVSKWPMDKALRFFFYISIAYAIIYTLFNQTLMELSQNSGNRSLVLSSSERADRLYMNNSIVSFGLIFAICNIRKNFILSAISILFFVYAIYLANSRIFTIVTSFAVFCVIISMLMPFIRPVISYCTAFIFLSLCFYSISGFFDLSINPYAQLFTDSSGAARYLEYRAAQAHFSEGNILLGLGIPPSTSELQRYVQSLAPFYPSDLGASGILFSFGIVGLIFFLFLSTVLILSITRRDANQSPERLGLYFSGFAAAMIGFFAATIISGSGTTICALVFAALLRNRRDNVISRLILGSVRSRSMPIKR